KCDDRNGVIGKEKSAHQNEQHAFEAAKLHSSGVQVSPTAKVGDAGIEDLKLPQTTITRSRSSRRSRDLDLNHLINDDNALVNNVPTSYASILLEDIQNFHHNNSNSNTTAFSLPPCVAKACSILDAVADLNSSTNSNISSAFSEERNSRPSNNNNNSYSSNISHSINVCSSNVHLGKTRLEVVDKDPFVQETEVLVNNDLMEPSIHKYITVRRGPEEMEQQESSGSNSIVGQQWFASSSWEPSSADSTDHWNAAQDEGVVDKEEPRLLVGHKKSGFLEGSRKSRSSALLTSAVTLSGKKKRELDHQLSKVGAKTQTAPIAAAASM
ncbi:Rho gtpase-activating protein, partial [Thalictrum thalictroides]